VEGRTVTRAPKRDAQDHDVAAALVAATPQTRDARGRARRRPRPLVHAALSGVETAAAAARAQPRGAQPTTTAFDLLDGAFGKVARARSVRLGAIAVATAMVAGISAQSVRVTVDASSVGRDREGIEAQLPMIRAQIASEAGIGNVTKSDLDAYLAGFGSGVESVTWADAPIAEVLLLLRQTVPVGSTLEGFSLSDRTVETAAVATVTVQASGYIALEQLRSALAAHPSVSSVVVVWTGAEELLYVTATVTFTTDVITDRAARFATLFPVPLGSPLRTGIADAAAAPDPSLTPDQTGAAAEMQEAG
jgi:hypothetical protein